MQADVYQDFTATTEVYSIAAHNFVNKADHGTQLDWLAFAYCAGKLNGEAGEVAELVFKALRDGRENPGFIDQPRINAIKKELGDVLWYVSRIAALCGVTLSSVMEDNMEKLQSRKDRGVLTGDGDER